MKYSTLFIRLGVFIGLGTLFLFSTTAFAEPANTAQQSESQLEKRFKINFLPRLLPIIIENSDVIELTDEQLNMLLKWRKTNRNDITATNQAITEKRLAIKEAALSPDTSSARLIHMQNEVFRLQRKVLQHKLACRDMVINTFNENNWEGLFLVLPDEELGLVLPEVYMSRR